MRDLTGGPRPVAQGARSPGIGAALLAVAVATALVLPFLGQKTLYHSDEARFALLARGMVEAGHWLVPRIGDEAHVEKPPLFMWAIALLSWPRGEVTEFTATLPAALAAIGGVGGTFVLGRRLFGVRAGLLASLILATSPEYFWHARLVLADMAVTCFVVWGAWAFWRAFEADLGWRPMALFHLFVALAVSSKGPAGLLPILPFGAFLVSEHGWRGVRRLRPVLGIGVLALVSAPWVIAFGLQQEKSYVQAVLLEDYLWWYFGPWRGVRDAAFVLGPLAAGMAPWSLFLPLAIREGWLRGGETGTRRKFRFLLLWGLAYLIVIALMAEKRTRYLLPMFPALALMVGWLWEQWASGAIRPGLRLHAWLWGGLAAGAALVVLLPLHLGPDVAVLVPSTLGRRLLLAGVLAAGGAGAVVASRAGKALAAFAAIWLAMGLALPAYYAGVLLPQYNRTYDVKGFARRIASRVRPEDPLVAFRYRKLSYDLYLRRTVPEIRDPEVLGELLSATRPVYVLAEAPAWRRVGEALGRAWPVVERAQIGGRTVILGTNAAGDLEGRRRTPGGA